MNGMTGYQPVEAEVHQSWPPKKETETNKQRKTEKEREKNTLLYI